MTFGGESDTNKSNCVSFTVHFSVRFVAIFYSCFPAIYRSPSTKQVFTKITSQQVDDKKVVS